MRAADLDLRELLAFEPEGGIIRFANERVLLVDAVAMGLLRRGLIDTLGLTGARSLLTRFGYAHGWRTAETLRKDFPLRGRFSRSEQLRQALAANPESRYSLEELSIAEAFADLPVDMRERLTGTERSGE